MTVYKSESLQILKRLAFASFTYYKYSTIKFFLPLLTYYS
jgi:hypothetical protein